MRPHSDPYLEILYVDPNLNEDDHDVIAEFSYWEWRAMQAGLYSYMGELKKKLDDFGLPYQIPSKKDVESGIKPVHAQLQLASAREAAESMYESIGYMHKEYKFGTPTPPKEKR
tara:strand:+ start:1202 stop:1543 length:342 start_codon:yes stop_codon:yes gene_type:complete